MKIEKIDLFQISLPLAKPFCFGTVTQTHRDHIILKVTADGVSGWGESGLLRWPYYNSETTDGAFTLLKDLLCPLVLGQTVEHPQNTRALLRPPDRELYGSCCH